MGLLSDFFLAEESPVPNYDGGAGFDAEDKCQFKGLTPLQGAQFLAVLRGQEYSVDMVSEFKLVTPEDADDWTMSVPDDMVATLARIGPDQIPGLAAEFSRATAEELGWSPDDFVPIIADLSALACRAIKTNKKMYLWNGL
jgi:hypothetical protein